MKKVGFIGAYDKTNLILSIAKILSLKSKRVLIVDTTAEQKLKYIVPTVYPTKTYITTWDDIDVAVGFENMQKICEYAGIKNEQEEYDVILFNIDNLEAINNMQIYSNDINLFITAVDLYSIRKGLEVFGNIKQPMKLVKVIFSRVMDEAENEYIDSEADNYRIGWIERRVFFPLILEDKYAEIDNQLIYRVGFKEMSQMYKDSLATLTSIIFEKEITELEAKRIIKILEKDGV